MYGKKQKKKNDEDNTSRSANIASIRPSLANNGSKKKNKS